MATFNDYLNEIKKTVRQPIFKIQFLRNDSSPFSEVVSDLSASGSLNIQNKNGTRRSVGFDLNNFDKSYFPELDSPIWIGKQFKLWMGYRINNEDFFLPQGVFVMDDPSTDSNGAIVSVSAVDKFALLDGSLGGEMDSIFIINAGTTLNTAIRSVMLLSNDTSDIIIDGTVASQTLPYRIIKETGDTIGAVLIEIANAFSCNVYYNENGQLTVEKDISDSIKGSAHKFNVSQDEVNYNGGNIRHMFNKVFNSCLVIGDNVNGAIATGRVYNNDLLSDTSIPNVGLERTLVIYDDIIYNNTLAVERAKYELKRATVVGSEGSIPSVPMYHLDVDRVITLTDDRLGFENKRFVINSLSIPFDNSYMSIGIVDSFELTLT
jgi:hypothetical protein